MSPAALGIDFRHEEQPQLVPLEEAEMAAVQTDLLEISASPIFAGELDEAKELLPA